jgi:hypothetical protein
MKKFIVISILLISFAPFAMCQDLLVRYDLVNKNISYFKIKENRGIRKLIFLRNPKVGANRNVKIEYINMNPFVWNQPNLKLVTVAKDSISSFNPFTMLLPTSFSARLGAMNFSTTRDAGTGNTQQQMCESALHSLYDAYAEIDALKYNYKLTKQQILDQIRMKIRNVMKICGSSFRMDTSTTEFKATDFESLNTYFQDICPVNIPVASRSGNDNKIDSFLGKAGIAVNNPELMPKDALSKIEQNYFILSDADFTCENSFIVSDKDMVLHMSFTLTNEYRKRSIKDSASTAKNNKDVQTVKDESIFIPVSGGIRISNSAGIGFTYVGASRKTYYLQNDSILASGVDNRIVPVVASFINAYSRGLGVVNVGGSFGIGVALQETLSLNFMFGATAVFGRNEKILLTAGFVLAPVNEPDKGYYVGMHTTNPDFPTKLNYEPGIFVCIHYNLGKFLF